MTIAVIDQGPELYWFVSNALSQEEIPLKHLQSIQAGEKTILQELPPIVIINGDDKALQPEIFINKMRNHVFARNTLFIVFTADTSPEFRKALLIAGAGQVLYRGRGYNPSPKFLAAMVKWFLNFKNPDPQIFDFKPVAFPADGEFTTYGRMGWINGTHCMIETNIDLRAGQSIEIKNSLFEELEIKNLKLECVEKNRVGRYYQYTNSILCKIISKDSQKDPKKIESWIQNNQDVSKHKPIKVVYFEANPEYRDHIRKMIKGDKRYCARGYGNILDFQELLDYQKPHLILINRELIQKDKAQFEALRKFGKDNFCYCITYATSEAFPIGEFKNEYDFAMHSQAPIDFDLLESMIKKLENKLPEYLQTDSKKFYFHKHSSYSRLSIHSACKLSELALNGVSAQLPFAVSNFCGCEISSNTFSTAHMNRAQYFRAFFNKGTSFRLIFMGQTVHENELVKDAIQKITEFGYDRWLVGDTKPDSDKIKV